MVNFNVFRLKRAVDSQAVGVEPSIGRRSVPLTSSSRRTSLTSQSSDFVVAGQRFVMSAARLATVSAGVGVHPSAAPLTLTDVTVPCRSTSPSRFVTVMPAPGFHAPFAVSANRQSSVPAYSPSSVRSMKFPCCSEPTRTVPAALIRSGFQRSFSARISKFSISRIDPCASTKISGSITSERPESSLAAFGSSRQVKLSEPPPSSVTCEPSLWRRTPRLDTVASMSSWPSGANAPAIVACPPCGPAADCAESSTLIRPLVSNRKRAGWNFQPCGRSSSSSPVGTRNSPPSARQPPVAVKGAVTPIPLGTVNVAPCRIALSRPGASFSHSAGGR